MLGDVDRIRAERKKARTNRNKFGGVEGGSLGGGLSSGSKYGGFGNEDSGSYGTYSGGVYGDGGGFGGNTSGFQDSTRRDRFEEYDEFDEGATKSPTRRKTDPSASTTKREPKQAEPPKKKEPEIDILGFDDEVPPETPPKELFSNGKKAVPNAMDDLSTIQSGGAGDDDFDDFQSATPAQQSTVQPSIQALPPPLSTTSTTSATQFAAPKPVSAFQGANLSDLVSFNSVSPGPSANNVTSPPLGSFASLPSTMQTLQQPRPTGYQAAQPNYFTSVPAPSTATPASTLGAKPSLQSSNAFAKPAAKSSTSSGGDVFGSLWSSASAGAGIKTNTPTNQGPNLASLAKEKASAGIWGAGTASTGSSQSSRPVGSKPKVGGGLDDLLG